MKAKNKNIVQKIVNLLLDIMIFIFGIVLFVSLYIGVQTKILDNDYANFFGYSIFEVQTGSMATTINAGDWIVVKLTQNVQLSDIVTYSLDGNFITHRIVEVYNNTYITQGDANSAKDKPIDNTQIVGKVSKILPKFGIIRKTLLNPIVLIAIIITLVLFNMAIKKSNNKILDKVKEIFGKFRKQSKEEDLKDTQNEIKELEKTLVLDKIEDDSLTKSNSETEDIKVENNILEQTSIEEEKLEEPKIELVSEPVEITEDKNAEEKTINAEETAIKVEENVTNTEELNKAIPDFIKMPIEDNSLIENEQKEEMPPKSIDPDIKGLDDLVYKEDDLEKTAMFRYVLVEENEMNNMSSTPDVSTQEPEKEEEKQKEPPKELTDDEKDTSLRDITNGKKCKNIIERVMAIKIEELTEIINLLEDNNKNTVNEATIKNEFTDMYINTHYYVIGNTKDSLLKIEDEAVKLSEKLINDYKGSDTKYEEKVKKYEKVFIALYKLEQIWESKVDLKKKQLLYIRVFTKIYGKENIRSINIRYLIGQIVSIRKKYQNILDYFLKKLDTNAFVLKVNKLSEIPNTYGLELKHNIEFNKIYSSYIINRTYSEGLIAEQRISVLLTLLLKQIVNDMLKSNYTKNYILYLPDSLYDKEKKLERVLSSIDDNYAKDKVIILVSVDNFINYKKLIKELIEKGYKFAILYNKEIKVGYENFGDLYSINYIFVDKDSMDLGKSFPVVPEEVYSKFIDEDIINKVDDFGSE